MTLEFSDYQRHLYNDHVLKYTHNKMGDKTTVVLVKLNNGFEIVGVSSCLNPDDYKLDIGVHLALVDALKKLDELVAFQKTENVHKAETAKSSPKRTFGLKDAENITINIHTGQKSGQDLADAILNHLAKYKKDNMQ